MAAEKVPAEHKVVHKILDDPAVGPHESAFYAELYVDGAYGDDFATIDADGFAFMGLDFILEEGRVASDHVLTDARSLTASVA